MAKKQSSISSAQSMRGEGLPIPMHVTKMDGDKAETRFDLGAAGAPDRRFFADAVFFQSTPAGHRIAFLQREFFGRKPRALFEIFLSNDASLSFKRTLQTVSIEEPAEHFDVDVTAEPINSIAYSAVFVRMASNPMATTVDFFNSSPWGLANGDKVGMSYVDPVVRVNTTVAVFNAIVRYFISIEGNLA